MEAASRRGLATSFYERQEIESVAGFGGRADRGLPAANPHDPRASAAATAGLTYGE